MFKKKKIIVDTQIDTMVREKNLKLFSVRADLKRATENVIIANGVIELYPEGADKEKAKATAENKKLIMLSFIGKYDNLKNEVNELLNNDNRNTTRDWQKCTETSHKIVEIAYKEFYKKA